MNTRSYVYPNPDMSGSEKIQYWLSTEYQDGIRKNLDYARNFVYGFAGEKLSFDFESESLDIFAKESVDVVLSSDVVITNYSSGGGNLILKKLSLSNDILINNNEIEKEGRMFYRIECPTKMQVMWNKISLGIEMLIKKLYNVPMEHPDWLTEIDNRSILTNDTVLDELKNISDPSCPFNINNFLFALSGKLEPFEVDPSVNEKGWHMMNFLNTFPEDVGYTGYEYYSFDKNNFDVFFYTTDSYWWMEIDFKLINPVFGNVFDKLENDHGEKFFRDNTQPLWNYKDGTVSLHITKNAENNKIVCTLDGGTISFNIDFEIDESWNFIWKNPSEEFLYKDYIYSRNGETLAFPNFDADDSIVTKTDTNVVSAEFQPLKNAISETYSVLDMFECSSTYDIQKLIQTTLYN